MAVPFIHRTPDGFYFKIDPGQYIDGYIYIDGIFERSFLDGLKGKFPEGAVALDIGANIGNHAIYLSRDFAEIHCFEPNPHAVERLLQNLSLSGATHIKVHPVGLGSEDAVLPFRENLDGNLGCSGFVEDTSPVQNSAITYLPVKRGDNYVASLGLERLDYIKIDVEGFELSVLEGLRRTTEKYRPVVSFEYHGQSAAPGTFEAIKRCLPDYAIIEPVHAPESGFAKKLSWNVRNAGAPVFKAVKDPEPRTYDNILAVPPERLDRFCG